MSTINGINIPNELLSNKVFNIGLKIGEKCKKSNKPRNLTVSGSDVVICGIRIDKQLFNQKLFQLGFDVGKKDNVSVPAEPVFKPRPPLKSCLKRTSSYAPVPVSILPVAVPVSVPVPNHISNLIRFNSDFPFAIRNIHDPNDFRDIPSNNKISEGYALVYIDPNNYRCYATNTTEFENIKKTFRINTIQIYEENGHQFSRVQPLDTDGTVRAGFTLTIDKRKKI